MSPTAPPLMPTPDSDESGDGISIRPASFAPPPPIQHTPAARTWRRRWLIALPLIATAAVLYFLATLRSVSIAIEPETARLALRGGLVIPFGGRFVMRPGSYQLGISAPGYVELRTDIEVRTAPDSQDFRYQLEKRPGRLRVKLEPAVAAELFIDDGTGLAITAAESGWSGDLKPGPHRLRIVADRHYTAYTSVDIAGGGIEQRLTMSLPPALASSSETSAPLGGLEVPKSEAAPAPGAEPLAVRGGVAGTSDPLDSADDSNRESGVDPEASEPEQSPPSSTSSAQAAATGVASPSVSLVLFQGGRIEMGSSRREHGRKANEILHSVALTRPFYLATHELTNEAFRDYDPSFSSGAVEGESLDGAKQPVVNVTWETAAKYCNWLSDRDRLPRFYRIEADRVIGFDASALGYRLPSEAEWEWAARTTAADRPLIFPWGMESTPPQIAGNYADRSAAKLLAHVLRDYDDGYRLSAPVGSFSPNVLGLYDMGGNVAEWVHDVYDIGIPEDGVTVENPLGKPSGPYHLIRGSSWAHGTITELRLAFRDYSNKSREDVGFRLARYLN